MASFFINLLLLYAISISLLPQPSIALRLNRRLPPPPEKLNSAASPTTYFEVTKPITHPDTKPCSYLLLRHDFGYTYGNPPVLAAYTPPTDCRAKEFSTVVLEWSATCKGRQFDRIFGVWLGGVELLRSCTAEPRPNGIVWKVEKDITRYYSLLMSNQTLAVYLGNVVTTTYTGVYHVEISIHFYPSKDAGSNLASGYGNWADRIIPISRNLPLNDGLWFEIENSTDVQTKEFELPINVYKAVLEVYVSFHENDEFWYSNLPNDYISANNISGANGNGPFREVIVTLDDSFIVGAIWPFTVVYTGGINPLLWRPITGLGSFDLPTYDIELTPFLGKLLDEKTHRIGFGVTNALNVWYVDANLHLWLDEKSSRTFGKLSSYHAPDLHVSVKSGFSGLNGTFMTKANRTVLSSGWVRSSYGEITTSCTQEFSYLNLMLMGDNGNVQIVNQTIDFNTSVYSKTPSSEASIIQSYKNFPLYMYSGELDQGEDGYIEMANVTLGFNEDKVAACDLGNVMSSVKNAQDARGVMVVQNNLVVSGFGTTQQVYEYNSGSEPCFYRNVSSSNYTVFYDEESTECIQKQSSYQLVLD
ncbi:hypothetical protein V2J09_017239 [Rumex salicifolius]